MIVKLKIILPLTFKGTFMFELAISYAICDMATSKINIKNKHLYLNSFSNQNGK